MARTQRDSGPFVASANRCSLDREPLCCAGRHQRRVACSDSARDRRTRQARRPSWQSQVIKEGVRASSECCAGQRTACRQRNPKGLNVDSIRWQALQQLSEWKGLLAQNVPIARQILRKVLEGRLVFVPRHCDEHWYEFSGEGSLTKFFVGMEPLSNAMASQGLPSWNQISTFLAAMRTLRDSGTWAA